MLKLNDEYFCANFDGGAYRSLSYLNYITLSNFHKKVGSGQSKQEDIELRLRLLRGY